MKCILIVLLFHITACASYLENRRHDLIDSASVNAAVIGRGIRLDLGPLSAGWYDATQDLRTVKFGLGGSDEISAEKEVEIHEIGLAPLCSKKSLFGNSMSPHNSRWGYGSKMAPFGALRFDIGYALTVGAQIDVIEIIDLVLGLATIDILQDDDSGTEEVNEKPHPNHDPERAPTK